MHTKRRLGITSQIILPKEADRDLLLEIKHYKATRNLQIAAAKKAQFHQNIMARQRLNGSKKRGVWIYGPPGTGKSSTVYAYTKGVHFNMSPYLHLVHTKMKTV